MPRDRGGQPSSACKFVLVGLANHAGPDGIGAFPSVATLVRYTGLAERTVRSCLDRLEAEGVIAPGDPDIVAARIKRADRRPQGWDLNLALVRDDFGEPGTTGPAVQSVARQVLIEGRLQRVRDDHLGGVQPVHPAAEPVGNRIGGVQRLHPNRPQNRPPNRPARRGHATGPLDVARAAGKLVSSSSRSRIPGG